MCVLFMYHQPVDIDFLFMARSRGRSELPWTWLCGVGGVFVSEGCILGGGKALGCFLACWDLERPKPLGLGIAASRHVGESHVAGTMLNGGA